MSGGIDPNELFAQMFGQAMGGRGGGFRSGGFGPGVQFGFGPGMGAGVQAADLNELLSGLFRGAVGGAGPAGGGPGGGPQASSQVVVKSIELSLEELYKGGRKTATFNGKTFSIDVRKGWKVRPNPLPSAIAPTPAHGPSAVPPTAYVASMGWPWFSMLIPLPSPLTLYMQKGTRITFEDDGVCFQVKEAEHPRFQRQGNDLTAVVHTNPISFLFKGSVHEITTLDQRTLTVSIPPLTLRRVVLGEGMPFMRTDADGSKSPDKGNLIVYLFANWSTAKQNAET